MNGGFKTGRGANPLERLFTNLVGGAKTSVIAVRHQKKGKVNFTLTHPGAQERKKKSNTGSATSRQTKSQPITDFKQQKGKGEKLKTSTSRSKGILTRPCPHCTGKRKSEIRILDTKKER